MNYEKDDEYVQDSADEDLPRDVMEGYVEAKSDSPDSDSTPSDSSGDARLSPSRKKFALAPHIIVNEGDPPTFTCSVCKCRFASQRSSRYHDFCAQGKRPFKCRLCGKRYVRMSYLNQHIKTHTGEKPFQCRFCDKAFHIKHKLNRHERIHTGKKGDVKCSQCGQTFLTKEALKKHEVRKHSARTTFTCKTCKKLFAEEAVYLAHVKTHSAARIYVCEHCGKSFKKGWNLTVHKRIHMGQKPFSCDVCKLTFRIRQHLERHCLRHQPDPDFECTICKATFRRRDNLLRHLKLNHPGRHVGVWTKEDREAARTSLLWRQTKETSDSADSELQTRFPNIRFARKRDEETSHGTGNRSCERPIPLGSGSDLTQSEGSHEPIQPGQDCTDGQRFGPTTPTERVSVIKFIRSS